MKETSEQYSGREKQSNVRGSAIISLVFGEASKEQV